MTPWPARDWLIALVVLIALAIFLLGYSGYTFWSVQTGGFVEPKITLTPTPKVTRAELTSLLERYRERRENFQTQNFDVAGLTDPAR